MSITRVKKQKGKEKTYPLAHAPLDSNATDGTVAGLDSHRIERIGNGLAVLAALGAGLDLVLERRQVGAGANALGVRVQPALGTGVVGAEGARRVSIAQIDRRRVEIRRQRRQFGGCAAVGGDAVCDVDTAAVC